jgi:hypothetical protein
VLTCDEVEKAWRGLIDGSRDRDEVYQWSRRWVEDEPHPPAELMALDGIHYLHGFYSVRDEAGAFRYDTDDIANQVQRWLYRCADHDADPEGWPRRRSITDIKAMSQWRDRSDVLAHGRFCVRQGWLTDDELAEILASSPFVA